jgi:ABC exporter DevB family membrane fusion protein
MSPAVVLAAPGRVEGKTEATEIGSGSDGVLTAVFVEEGQHVAAGQLLATVSCVDIEREVNAASADAESRRQARIRLLRGSRDEERARAAAETSSAQAIFNQSELQYRRVVSLVEAGVVSRETFESAKRDLEVARANLRATVDRERLVNAPPLAEDVARADAEVQAALDRVNTNVSRLDKCRIKSPISGKVLRVYKRPGENISSIYPQPILSVADTSRLRIRAEVDERDFSLVQLGQKVLITTDGSSERSFGGAVISLGSQMGRKHIRSGDPAEKSDRDVLEVLIDLDENNAQLVVGLRVTVQFLAQR